MTELPDELTYGEAYNPAMLVTTKEEAADYFAALVRRNIRVTGNSDEEAARIERINVGYWTGYYDRETAVRVRALYGVAHPIFGNDQPTPETAVAAGQAAATLSAAIGGASIAIEAFGRAVQAAGLTDPDDGPSPGAS